MSKTRCPKILLVCDNAEKSRAAKQTTDDDTSIIRRIRILRWITKTTKTQSEYAILIPFPIQQYLLERAVMYCVRLVNTYKGRWCV
jgi:hypothetical protein